MHFARVCRVVCSTGPVPLSIEELKTTMTQAIAARPTRSLERTPAARMFYSASALLILALVVTGFRHFYFEGGAYPGRPITPPIRTLIIAHGVSMSAWLILFAVQPMLVASGNPRTHMKVGKIGGVLALAILILGTMVAVQSARVTPPEQILWTLDRVQFMAVPLIGVWVFAGFVAVGLWKRKKPATHRAMMLCGTLAASAAGFSRIDFTNNLYIGTAIERIFGPFLVTSVLAVALLAIRCMLIRSLDRALAIGTCVLIAACVGTMLIARTGAWHSFATMLTG